MAVPSETSVPSPLSDAEVEAWFEEEDSESSERPSNIPRAVQRSRLGLGESEMQHADANRRRVAA
jgi:hypothetical protein